MAVEEDEQADRGSTNSLATDAIPWRFQIATGECRVPKRVVQRLCSFLKTEELVEKIEMARRHRPRIGRERDDHLVRLQQDDIQL